MKCIKKKLETNTAIKDSKYEGNNRGILKYIGEVGK